jgi:hypothetical protein
MQVQEKGLFGAFLETKSTALTSLPMGSYAHTSGIRPSNLDDTAVASLKQNAEFCSNLLFCNR